MALGSISAALALATEMSATARRARVGAVVIIIAAALPVGCRFPRYARAPARDPSGAGPAIKSLCVACDPSGAPGDGCCYRKRARAALVGIAWPAIGPGLFAGGDQIRVLTRCRGQAGKNDPAILDGDAPHLIGAVEAAPFPGLAIPPVLLRRPHVEEAGELHGANAAHDLDPVVPGLAIEPHSDLGVGGPGMQGGSGADVVGLGDRFAGEETAQKAGNDKIETKAH